MLSTLFSNITHIFVVANNPNCTTNHSVPIGSLIVRFNHCSSKTLHLYDGIVDILATNGHIHDLMETNCGRQLKPPRIMLAASYNITQRTRNISHVMTKVSYRKCSRVINLAPHFMCSTGLNTIMLLREYFHEATIILQGFHGRKNGEVHRFIDEYNFYKRQSWIQMIC